MARMLIFAVVLMLAGCCVGGKKDAEYELSASAEVEGKEIDSVSGDGVGGFKLMVKASKTWK